VNNIDANRVRAVVRKELRDYRRKRAIVVTMAIFPIIFLLQPVLEVFLLPAGTPASSLAQDLELPLLYLLLIPTIMPSTLAAYAVVGEREQGTLEPLLTTPIRQQEFILGKAAAVMLPTLVLSYTVFGIFMAIVELFARPIIATTFFHQGGVLLALFLLTPLLAGWAIVVGMAISVRASEVRVAQQLGTLASFPPIGIIALLAVGVVTGNKAVSS
jgi:ABC-type transport system involved in multi-copper enzyme maturation permease subunit